MLDMLQRLACFGCSLVFEHNFADDDVVYIKTCQDLFKIYYTIIS
jgi:hypothetical protein